MPKPAISVQKRRAVYKKWKLQRSLVNFFRRKDLWSPRKANSKPRYGNWQLTLLQGEPQSHINLMCKIGKRWSFTSMPTSWGRGGANHPQRQSLNLSISLTFPRDLYSHDVKMPMEWDGCPETMNSIFWPYPIPLVVQNIPCHLPIFPT